MQVPVSLRPVKRKHILLPIIFPTYESFFEQNEILGMRLKHIKPISLIYVVTNVVIDLSFRLSLSF